MDPGIVRLGMTGFTPRHPFVLALVAINTEQQPVLGGDLIQHFPFLNMASGTLIRAKRVRINNLQWSVRLMTLATVGIGLPLQVRGMTVQAAQKLTMLLMTILAIEQTVIARIVPEFRRLPGVTAGAGGSNPQSLTVIDPQRSMRVMATEAITDGKMPLF